MDISTLSVPTQRVIETIAAQLANYEKALQGVAVTISERELVCRRGKLIVEATHEERRILDREQTFDDLVNLREIFADPGHVFEELPGSQPNQNRVRVTHTLSARLGLSGGTREDVAITLTLSRSPARVLRMEAEAVHLPLWLRLLLKSQATEVVFDYVHGVPVPTSLRQHIASRGIGWLRLGGGKEIDVQYRG